MAKFNKSLDIQNRTLQHLGQPRVASTTEFSKGQTETTFIIDKVRRAELRRAVWTFATRRMILRPAVLTSSEVAFPTYSLTTAYTAGDIVLDSNGYLWLCKTANTGVTPGTESFNAKWVVYFGNLVAQPWSASATYVNGDMVYVTGTLSVIYLCVSPTINNTPPNTTYWHVVQGATSSLVTRYSPLGYSPDTTVVRPLFYLPANYMRMAPQEPKIAAGSTSNVTNGMRYNDWEIEDGILSSATSSVPFVLRFVADQPDVTRMDDMFCEAVAARMAMELCETFTQSQDKMDRIGNIYERSVTAARLVSAIEAGTTEDDFADLQAQQQRGQRG